MANIWEKDKSILAGNLDSGLSYLITTVRLTLTLKICLVESFALINFSFFTIITFLSWWAFQSKRQESKQFQHSFDLESLRIFSVHNSLQTAQPTLESIKYLHFWLDIQTKLKLWPLIQKCSSTFFHISYQNYLSTESSSSDFLKMCPIFVESFDNFG